MNINIKKMLIVDDDSQTRRLLWIAFGYEYEVFQAADGIEALRMILDHQPDVVLLDGMMPRLDGLAVLSGIKSDPKLSNIMVVMITGRSQFSDLENGIQLGADAYFIKPLDHKKLKAWVDENLKLREISEKILASKFKSDGEVDQHMIH